MSDDLPSELIEEDLVIALAAPEPVAEVVAEVEFAAPAPAYEAIATHEALPPAVAVASGPPLHDELAALGRKLDGLQALFEREIRAEATREKIVDRLHAELQEYKQNLVLSVLRPIFVDLIQLHDDVGKIGGAQPEDAGRFVALLSGVQQGIEDVLYRQGVEPFRHDGETFDPKRQRAVTTVPTDDPALNKSVASRLRPGWRVLAGDKMIRPEIVSVHALKKP